MICQNKVCCNTTTLPGIYGKGSTIKYSGSDLNNCENWPMDNMKDINAVIYHYYSCAKYLHFSFFAKKRRKFQNLCKESEEIAKEKK